MPLVKKIIVRYTPKTPFDRDKPRDPFWAHAMQTVVDGYCTGYASLGPGMVEQLPALIDLARSQAAAEQVSDLLRYVDQSFDGVTAVRISVTTTVEGRSRPEERGILSRGFKFTVGGRSSGQLTFGSSDDHPLQWVFVADYSEAPATLHSNSLAPRLREMGFEGDKGTVESADAELDAEFIYA